jgi:hypothetical protein
VYPRRVVARFFGALLAALAFASTAAATTGGDAHVEVLGWNAERSTILAYRVLGGENEVVDLFAFNVAQRRVDRARCESCAGLAASDKPRNADERAYLRLLRSRARLGRLVATPRADWQASRLDLACSSEARVDHESGAHFRRQRCRVASAGISATFEFSAPSEWFVARLFRPPGHPEAVLAWVTHTGIEEFGYRTEELVIIPTFSRRAISCSKLAHLYAVR